MSGSIFLAALMATAPTTVAGMKWEHRIVLVAAPSGTDPALAEQRRILAGWREGGKERDVALVTVSGDTVDGATDTAASLRKAYRLPAARFEAILIGKDGGEKLRSPTPFSAATLRDTIDSMPMRQAGGR